MKTQSEIYKRIALFVVLLLFVMLLHIVFNEMPYLDISYAELYGALVVAWMISLHTRVVEKRVRALFFSMAAFMLFFYVLQMARYKFFPDQEIVLRYLWYCYYIPMVFIPLICFYISRCLVQYDRTNPLRKWTFLIIPGAALVILVLTNDIHEKAFRFVSGADEGYYSHYSYGPVYHVVFAWVAILLIITFVNIVRGYRFTLDRFQFFTPFLSAIFLTGFTLLDLNNLIPEINGTSIVSLTDMFNLTIVTFWELCIYTGLVRTNGRYSEIFSNTRVAAEIADYDGNVIYKAKDAPELTKEEMSGDTVKLISDNIRLFRANLRGGYLYWEDDISEIAEIREQLSDVREQLSQEREILIAEKELKEQETQITTETRLYDMIREAVMPRLEKIEYLLSRIPDSELRGEVSMSIESRRLLAMACVLNAYVKRRSNLMIMAEDKEYIPAEELTLSIRESCEYIALLGANCSLDINISGFISGEKLIEMYDIFEKCIEAEFENLESVRIELTGVFDDYRRNRNGTI